MAGGRLRQDGAKRSGFKDREEGVGEKKGVWQEEEVED